jgi:hypothetical protein
MSQLVQVNYTTSRMYQRKLETVIPAISLSNLLLRRRLTLDLACTRNVGPLDTIVQSLPVYSIHSQTIGTLIRKVLLNPQLDKSQLFMLRLYNTNSNTPPPTS